MDLFNEKYFRGNYFPNLYVKFVLLSGSYHSTVQLTVLVEVRNLGDMSDKGEVFSERCIATNDNK